MPIAPLLLACAPLPPVAAQAPRFDDSRQILWQRSIDDALALSRAWGRPLLIAVNADGESASELIVRERYRDPRWVAHTRPFVCVVASYFRHSPRDHDDDGRRLACPRFGEVTCGEHMALEPATHERFLAGVTIELFGETTDRISPRHVLVSPQGQVLFDRYLLFDLGELDAELESAARRWPAPPEPPVLAWPLARGSRSGDTLDLRARARLASEDRFAAAGDELLARLAELGSGGPSLLELLRRAGPSFSGRDLAPAIFTLTAPRGELESARAWLREVVNGEGESSPRRIEAFALLGASRAADRTLYRSFVALGSDAQEQAAFAVLPRVEGDAVANEWAAERAAAGAFLLSEFVRQIEREARRPARESRVRPPLAEEDELETALAALEPRLASDPSNARHQREAGRLLLALARRRIQDRRDGVGLLLEDAGQRLALAARAWPGDVSLLLERARVANLLSRFDEQERLALEALRVGAPAAPEGFHPDNAEALRWLGDAYARRLAERSGGGALDELLGIARGGAAFALATRAEDADATDWLSLASFFGALGRSPERVQFAFEGLRRFPASSELWLELTRACDARGAPGLHVELAERAARGCADWAEPQWYAGHARVLAAQWARRGEDADAALAHYEAAQAHFARALELAEEFRESCEHYLAMCALGRGFAHLIADRRELAARCVVEAARIRPAVVAQRDGLDRDALDLVDGVLEARGSGPTPVDGEAWLAELQRVDPGSAFWARAVADAQLREAIRAYERGRLELGDAHAQQGIAAARRARAIGAAPQDDEALAQVLLVFAERIVEHGGERARAESAVREAAATLDLDREAEPSTRAWPDVMAELRQRLGPARPAFRPGR